MALVTLVRPKHWIKNLFVVIPLLVSGNLFNQVLLWPSLLGFVAFCLVSSAVYVFNDMIDIANDRNHPKKRDRPLAAGEVTLNQAIFLIIILLLLTTLICIRLNLFSIFMLVAYSLLNILYSLIIKRYAIIDIISISLGFVCRVQMGVFITELNTSAWLLVLTFSLSMLLALGKRKAELHLETTDTRKSLGSYTKEFIGSLELVFLTNTLVFYVMYTFFSETFPGDLSLFAFSSIFVVAGLSRYLYLTINEQFENLYDPVEILYKDKFILVSVILWVFYLYICVLLIK